MTEYWTLVQHSAWLVNRDPDFKYAVEVYHATQREAEKIIKAGGRLFLDYGAASDAEYRANYPDEEYQGLIPRVRGTFSDTLKIDDGRPVFIPAAEDAERHPSAPRVH